MPSGTAPYQFVAFFEDTDGRGWSEKYWLPNNPNTATADALASGYFNVRKDLMTSNVKCIHIRIGTSSVRSPFVYYPAANGGGVGTLSPPTESTDIALLFDVFDANRHVNRIFMRGVPDDIISLEEYTPSSQFTQNIDAFKSWLVTASTFAVKTSLGTIVPVHQILTAASAGGNGYIITVAKPSGITQGSILRVKGSPTPGYNGLKMAAVQLTDVGAAEAWRLSGANPLVDPPTGTVMSYTIPQYNTAAIADASVIGVSRRKTGRPFGVPVGRRPTLFPRRR